MGAFSERQHASVLSIFVCSLKLQCISTAFECRIRTSWIDNMDSHGRDVHDLMLSIHDVPGRPLSRFPSAIPCSIVLASPVVRLICPYHLISHKSILTALFYNKNVNYLHLYFFHCRILCAF